MDGCGHCGYTAPLEHKGNVVAESHSAFHKPIGEYSWQTIWSLHRCPQCAKPSLETYTWSDELSDPEATTTKILFPSARDDSSLPEPVARELQAARLVKNLNPGLFALCIRRMLEAVCLNQGAAGDSLNEQLQDLASQGRMPQVLVDISDWLRRYGNLGAHVTDIEVLPSDVPLLEDLADATLEYLYRAPAKVNAVQAEFEKRKKAVQG